MYFPLTYPFSCPPEYPFFLIFILASGTKMNVRCFCWFCAMPAIVDVIYIFLKQYFNFVFLILTLTNFFLLFFT